MNYLERKIFRSEMIDCSLCYDAPCSKACLHHLDPAKLLRNVWFDNENAAAAKLPDGPLACMGCRAKCELACNQYVHIPIVLGRLYGLKENGSAIKPDESLLKTEFCGFPLENPFLLSSSVVSSTYEKMARAFEAGWAGAATKTVTTMDIHEASPRYSATWDAAGEIQGFKNIEQLSQLSVQENADIIRRLKKDYPTKYMLVSIMGKDDAEWAWLAKEMQKAGADALELNFSCPNMVEEGTGSAIGQQPEVVKHLTKVVKDAVTIPVIAKLTPNVASMSEAAEAAVEGGADGIAAINTLKSLIPVADTKVAVGGLSGKAVFPIALRFISELGLDHRLSDTYISAMGGVETWRDAAEFIGYGANTVQVTTAVMEYGIDIISDLKEGLAVFLAANNTSLEEITGRALSQVVDTEDMERDVVVYPKFDRDLCTGCGRCFVSCRDGGHEAIRFDGEKRIPVMDAKKCVGCHLCVIVCPECAITSSGVSVKKKKED